MADSQYYRNELSKTSTEMDDLIHSIEERRTSDLTKVLETRLLRVLFKASLQIKLLNQKLEEEKNPPKKFFRRK